MKEQTSKPIINFSKYSRAIVILSIAAALIMLSVIFVYRENKRYANAITSGLDLKIFKE